MRIIVGHTDVRLGDCSYLNTCRHMKACKFVHYKVDPADMKLPVKAAAAPHAQRVGCM